MVYLVDTAYGPHWLYRTNDGRVFAWNGGPYIDMLREDTEGEIDFLGIRYSYTDVNIGVWDHSKDKPSIDNETSNDFESKVKTYLAWEDC
jgi:hypothetical protein